MNRSLQIQSHVRSMIDTDGAVLLDLKRGKYYSLNVVGAQIWTKAQEGRTLPEILNHLQETFDAPIERLQNDLTAFIDGLAEKGLAHVNA
jgi:hypothetical protein